VFSEVETPAGPKSGSKKHGAVARQFEKVHLMRRRKAAEFAKEESDVTLGRIGSRIGLPAAEVKLDVIIEALEMADDSISSYLDSYDHIAQEEVCVFLRELELAEGFPLVGGGMIRQQKDRAAQVPQPCASIHVSPSSTFPPMPQNSTPAEGVWSLAKRQLANGRPDDVDELMEDVIRTMERIRRSRTKLRGCVLQSELPFFLC
jgi:hypothetical protein